MSIRPCTFDTLDVRTQEPASWNRPPVIRSSSHSAEDCRRTGRTDLMKKVLFLLGELRDIDIEWLIANGQRRAVRADEVLIRQGQPLDALFLVLDGTLEVSGGGGMPFLLGCGEVVGEISFVDSRPPTATVKALEDAIV